MENINLILELERRHIDLEKMINKDEAFVTAYYGSSGIDMGCSRNTKRQVEILFTAVPEFFPYDFKAESFEELTQDQSTILKIINKIDGHPSSTMFPKNIPKMINMAQYYLRKKQVKLKEEGILRNY